MTRYLTQDGQFHADWDGENVSHVVQQLKRDYPDFTWPEIVPDEDTGELILPGFETTSHGTIPERRLPVGAVVNGWGHGLSYSWLLAKGIKAAW